MSRAHLFATALAVTLCACKPDNPAPQSREAVQRQKDELAGYLLRLGHGRWMVACAFEVAKSGGNRETATKQCAVDLDAAVAPIPPASGGTE